MYGKYEWHDRNISLITKIPIYSKFSASQLIVWIVIEIMNFVSKLYCDDVFGLTVNFAPL